MIQSIQDGRREAGQRSIADKIIKRLHDLEKTVENNQGRWAWELLQNAKDSIAEDDNRTVSIQIELDENSVTFKHNGTHFTSQDVVGLIDQISSKEVEEGQETKKTGRFGTGFLTTHLLSRVIKIKGIIGSPDGSFHKFDFLLDRRGKKIVELMPRIKNSWKEFDESIEKISPNYAKNSFNTSFCYKLDTEKQRRIACVGVEEFSKLIPFVLAFIPKIERVEIIDSTAGERTICERNTKLKDDLIVHVGITKNDKQEDVSILCCSNNKVAIATEVVKGERGYSVKGVRDFPKLFCDFPLIGTEKFHFPMVVNSFFFNPQTERDGIWLKESDDPEVIENQEPLKSATDLYRELVSRIIKEKFFDLYNIAETKMPAVDDRYFNKEWYQEFIQTPIRQFIYHASIVELEDESSDKKAIKDLFFPEPSFSKPARDKVWQFIFDLAPDAVCIKKHLHNWCDIAWEDWEAVGCQKLISAVEDEKNIQILGKSLGREEDSTFEWLNYLGAFLLEKDSNLILIQRKNSIIPNKNGSFKRAIDLSIDAIEDDELIYVLELLGEDWKDILLHDSISYIRDYIETKDKKDIAVRITGALNRELKKSSYNKNEHLVKAIGLLSEWFENNSELGKELFPDIYRKRADIFMNTIRDKDSLYKVMRTCTDLSRLAEVAKAIENDSEIIEKIQRAKEMTLLLEEFRADDLSDLKTMLRLAQETLADDSKKIEINQKVLLSLGVTSIEELGKALQDKRVASKFIHTSKPTIEMFLVVQKLIERARSNIIQHLKSLKEYDCTDAEELATTIIGGIKKDGLPIYVVVRPSDNGEVIIYYSSEKDTLDDPSSELWIDNGSDAPERLTLGKILKTTGINRIPVN